ncbi:MAG: aldo/keto reductase [Lacunisphaera sp.]|nr:aldo/keto reductase [Lacunisphaera sp.]
MRYRPLGSTGLQVSVLSFGASSLGGVFHAVTEKQCVETVEAALTGGINFIDVSPAYGETLAEKNLGLSLRGIPRENYILATKIGSYSEARGDYDYSAARTRRSIDESLRRLGVDYVDLIQCHDVEFADHDQIIGETLPALADLKRQGLVRHIGITGLPLKIFPALLQRDAARTIDTVLSFCHYELNDTSLAGLLPDLKARGVGVINASPTGMGLLTRRGAPAWHPASPAIIAGCKRAVDYCRERGIDIVKPAVQFACGNPDIATTLVGTADPQNIRDNIACVEEPMDERLIAEIQQLLAPVINANFTRGRPEHRDPILALRATG